jgi:hypothetical protein
MLKDVIPFLKYCVIVFLFSYGIFYTSYKYGQPELGNRDFFRYEKMVDSPLNLHATISPTVLRQIPTLAAYSIKQAGIYYNSRIAFEDGKRYKGENTQQNFFALILSNYLAYIIAIALVISYLVKTGMFSSTKAVYLPVMAFSLGYFMVPVNIIAPLSQGYGWLVAVLLSIGLISRSMGYIVAGSVLAIFSRETTLLFFILLFAATAIHHLIYKIKNAFVYKGLLTMLGIFMCLLFLRSGFTHGNEAQLSPLFLIKKSLSAITREDYIFQAFFTQGLVFFLAGLVYIKYKTHAIIYLCAIAGIVLIGGFGVGRIIGESFPYLVLLYLLPATERYVTATG